MQPAEDDASSLEQRWMAVSNQDCHESNKGDQKEQEDWDGVIRVDNEHRRINRADGRSEQCRFGDRQGV